MAHNDPRYVRVNELWNTIPKLPSTPETAAAFAKAVCNKFGLKSLGGASMRRKYVTRKVRRVWLDKTGNGGLNRGWQRCAHDLSHRINRARHPNEAPHSDSQAFLEYEVACFAKDYIGTILASKGFKSVDLTELNSYFRI